MDDVNDENKCKASLVVALRDVWLELLREWRYPTKCHFYTYFNPFFCSIFLLAYVHTRTQSSTLSLASFRALCLLYCSPTATPFDVYFFLISNDFSTPCKYISLSCVYVCICIKFTIWWGWGYDRFCLLDDVVVVFK